MPMIRSNNLVGKVRNAMKVISKRKVILFVCTGNTCRSVMAEYIFKDYLKERKEQGKYFVESAGVVAAHPAEGINPLAKEALLHLEIKAGKHVPRQLDIKSANEAHLVVCMSKEHKDAIIAAIGYKDSIKTVDDITGEGDIEDPYGLDFNTYIETAKIIKSLCGPIYEAFAGKPEVTEETSDIEGEDIRVVVDTKKDPDKKRKMEREAARAKEEAEREAAREKESEPVEQSDPQEEQSGLVAEPAVAETQSDSREENNPVQEEEKVPEQTDESKNA